MPCAAGMVESFTEDASIERSRLNESKGILVSTTRTHAPAAVASESKLFRVAGIGALIAGLSYLIQPLIVFIIDPAANAVPNPDDPSAWYPDPANALESWYLGSEQSLQFALVAVGTLMLVIALGILARSRGAESGVWAQMSHVLGLASGIGWIVVAGLSFATHSLVAFSLTDFANAGLEAQKIGLQSVAIVLVGALALVSLATAGWVLGLATVGRKARIVGLPLAVLCYLAAAVLLANVFVNPTGFPFGQLAFLIFLLVFGIVFLVKARRSRLTASV